MIDWWYIYWTVGEHNDGPIIIVKINDIYLMYSFNILFN